MNQSRPAEAAFFLIFLTFLTGFESLKHHTGGTPEHLSSLSSGEQNHASEWIHSRRISDKPARFSDCRHRFPRLNPPLGCNQKPHLTNGFSITGSLDDMTAFLRRISSLKSAECFVKCGPGTLSQRLPKSPIPDCDCLVASLPVRVIRKLRASGRGTVIQKNEPSNAEVLRFAFAADDNN